MRYQTMDDFGVVHLQRFTRWEAVPEISGEYGITIDIETTGLDPDRDAIIELGIRTFDVQGSPGTGYSWLQDPGGSIPAEVTALTGITDKDVDGAAINWEGVDRIISGASIVIAHNARFDRAFIDKHSPASMSAPWSCSMTEIPWSSYGLPSGLEFLLIGFGYHYQSHRALIDADALLLLLQQKVSSVTDKPNKEYTFLDAILDASRFPMFLVTLTIPFDRKDEAKARGYYWDATARSWRKEIAETSMQAELDYWATVNVYAKATTIERCRRHAR